MIKFAMTHIYLSLAEYILSEFAYCLNKYLEFPRDGRNPDSVTGVLLQIPHKAEAQKIILNAGTYFGETE